MRYAGIKLAGNMNQTLVAIQNAAMRLSQHSDGGGACDGGGTEALSGSDSGGQARPPQYSDSGVAGAFTGSDGRTTIPTQRWQWGK